MIECMFGVTGKLRHTRFTPADYVIRRESAWAEDHRCRQCLLEMLRTVAGEDILTIDIYRPITTEYDRKRHMEVLALHAMRMRARKIRVAFLQRRYGDVK